jgi:hypothetical protein
MTNAERQHETLIEYLHEIAYPSLVEEGAEAMEFVDLCLWLHDEFMTFLGEGQADWIDTFYSEWVYLNEWLGATKNNAIIALRNPDVMHHLAKFV